MGLFSWLNKKHFPELRKMLNEPRPLLASLSEEDKDLIKAIHSQTSEHNCNNITRTKAYYDLYIKHSEMEWALLAHLVSRNAGWNMSDLKGEWIPRIFTEKNCLDYFLFIERANWLIFQDAYPQLLLYSYSKQKQKNLSYLLPYLNISRFMQVVWETYWLEGNHQLLCCALIINEQNYIEKRIIDKQQYGAPVLSDLKFFLQDILDLNMILIPSIVQGQTRLYGEQVNSFADLYERVELGKKLYQILFSKEVLPGVLDWCKNTVHSGSRVDYMPQLFSAKGGPLKTDYHPRLNQLKLLPNVVPLYSPNLTAVWPDYPHEPAAVGDWFKDIDIVERLQLPAFKVLPREKDYSNLLSKVEKAVVANQLIPSLNH